jgi:hypothetical protein
MIKVRGIINMVELESFSEIEKALSGLSGESKLKNLNVLKSYVEFTGLNPTQLIEEAKTDKCKPNPTYIPEQRLYSFFTHLLTNKEMDIKSACTYFNIVRLFYLKNNCPLKVSLPKALRYAEYVLGIHVKGLLFE